MRPADRDNKVTVSERARRLQRSLDKAVGIVGPVAILTISVVVGGLIVSVMTTLLSVTQLVG